MGKPVRAKGDESPQHWDEAVRLQTLYFIKEPGVRLAHFPLVLGSPRTGFAPSENSLFR
jgi:hypothetical protein